MEVTTKGRTNQNANGTEGETKARTRINPRVKMAKALYSILGENLREADYEEAETTTEQLRSYLESLNGD